MKMKALAARLFVALFVALVAGPAAHAQNSGLQAISQLWATAVGGSANAVTITVPNFGGPLRAGYEFHWYSANTNTGAATLAVNGLTAVNLYKVVAGGRTSLTGGEIQSTQAVACIYDGADCQILNPLQSAGSASFSGLEVDTTGNATTAITAAQVAIPAVITGAPLLTAGTYASATSISCTVTLTSSGQGGLDTGSPASSTWYNFWLIAGTSGVGCEASLQSAANATFISHLPTGYSQYALRVGADQTDGSAHLWRVIQKGGRAQIVSGTDPAALPILASGSSGSITTPTWSSVAVSSFVPPTASVIATILWNWSTSLSVGLMLAPNSSYSAAGSSTNPPPCVFVTPSSAGTPGIDMQCSITLESSSVYYASNAGTFGLVAVLGWEDNL